MGFKKNYTPWNKGLTKQTDVRVQKNSDSLSMTVNRKISDGSFIPTRMGPAARKRLSEQQSIKNRGGRSKWFEVAGQKVQGTWERTVAELFEKLSIKWVKLKVHRDIWKYTLNDKECSYTPDFYLPDLNVYLEVKGYWWGNDKEKVRIARLQNPDKNLWIVEKDQYIEFMRTEQVWSLHQIEVLANEVRSLTFVPQ